MKAKILIFLIVLFSFSCVSTNIEQIRNENINKYGTAGKYLSKIQLLEEKNRAKSGEINPDKGTKLANSYLLARFTADLGLWLVAWPVNLVYYVFTGSTIAGTIGSNSKKGSREERVEEIENRLNISLKEESASTGMVIEGSSRARIFMARETLLTTRVSKSDAAYFTSERLMDAFDPDEFGLVLADAEWSLGNLDLSDEDLEDLRSNGYLEYLEGEEKSSAVGSLEVLPAKTAPPAKKGKK